jgi:histidyl-tRNA synthetase
MEILNLYPPHIGGTVVDVFVTVFNEATRPAATRLAADLRAAGVRTELYLQDKNLGKQMSYADRKGIPVVAIVGEDEIAAGTVKLKRLRDGQEIAVPLAEAPSAVRALLAD